MECIVSDIDGTLQDGISPRMGLLAVVSELTRHLHLIVVTFRLEERRQQTEDWLRRQGLNPRLVLMPRLSGGYPEGFKRWAAHHLTDLGYEPRLWFEDDQRVVDVLRIEGYPMVNVRFWS